LVVGGILLASGAVPIFAWAAPTVAHECDIDADGFADLVIGAPSTDGNQPTEVDSGSIVILPGGADGPDPSRSWRVTQDLPGIPDRNETGDRLGEAVACADLDDDGFGDVIVGAPGERIADLDAAGMVLVLYGSPTGFDSGRNQRWTPQRARVSGDVVEAARFGAALAVGDFDGDDFMDLAVASPGIGVLHVLYGGARGITARTTKFDDHEAGLADTALGTALASGDFDGNGRDDLAVGAPGARPGGRVLVFWGSDRGLDTATHRAIDFAAPGIRGTAKPGAALGSALATADFDNDGRDDLAMGAPGYRHSGHGGAGIVLVLFGSRWRTGNRDRLVSSTSPARSAGFGSALVAGDFTGDGIADFAAGSPAADGLAPYAGRVEIRHGDASGNFADGEVMLGATLGAGFGSELAANDADGDGIDDLWGAAPQADVAGTPDAGALFFASGAGAEASPLQIDRTTRGIPGQVAGNERFGSIDAGDHRPPHAAMFLEVVDREAWSQRDPVIDRMDRHSIEEITIHHLGGTSTANGVARFRVAQNWHIDGLAWGDIAYHYIVGKDGRVYAARDPRWAGDTSTNYDPSGHLLIVAEGNFDIDVPSSLQLDALVATVAWAIGEWNVPVDAVTGHRDHAATACPGAHLYPYVASGDLAGDVEDLLESGGVWMVPAEGP
jgi:hypothetical protein